MENVRKFSTEQLQAKIEEKEMKLFLIRTKMRKEQGKIEQQQALSFWNCSQHELEPQIMSKEKGTSIKVGTQMFKKVPIGDLGTEN